MAGSPEDFVADPAEPFSPSVFLDLPPTPRPDGNGDGKDAASGDLVLPFIERMLMEEGIDDEFFYRYPGHPALLQAQESYARVLSVATAGSSTDGSPAMSVSSGSDTGVGADDLTADASTAPERSPARLGDAGVRREERPPQSGYATGEAEVEKKANSTMLAVIDGGHAVLASAFFSAEQDGGGKAMFLKGMEEANKFLPRDIGSATVVQVKEEESASCRGGKNWHNRD